MIDAPDEDVQEFGALLAEFMRTVADKPIDSGGGFGARDYWVTHNGVEYFVHVRKREATQKDGVH